MRVNVYAEELTDRVELTTKQIGDNHFTAIRFYLALPASYVSAPEGETGMRPATVQDTEQASQYQAPFIHHPGDDDSAAVTFWGKKDMRPLLCKALALLDEHEAKRNAKPACGHEPSNPSTGYRCVKCGDYIE